MKPTRLVKSLLEQTLSSVRNNLLPLGFSVRGRAVGAKSGCFSLVFSLVSLPLWLFSLLFAMVLAITMLVYDCIVNMGSLT